MGLMAERDSDDGAYPIVDTTNTKIGNGNPAPDAKLKDSELNKSSVHVKTSPLGIYTLFTEVSTLGGLLPGYDIWAEIQGFLQDWPYIKIFIIECVSLGPRLILQWAILSMISSLLPALSLYLSGNLLGLIQTGFENRNLNPTRFYVTAACLLASKTLESIIDFACQDTIREIKRQSTFHFGDHLIRAHLRLDFPTSVDPSNKTTLKRISPNHAGDQGFRIMEGVVSIATAALQTVSGLLVLFSMIRHEPGGYLFASLAAIEPLFNMTRSSRAPRTPFFVFLTNEAYARMQTFVKLSQNTFRSAVIRDGIQDYIQNEYRKSVQAIGDHNIDDPWNQMSGRPESLRSFISSIAPDLPMILFTLRSIHSPGTIPLKSLTLLTTTIAALGYRLQTLLYYTRSTSGYRKTIVALYQALEIKNILKDGDIPYPAPDVPVPGGMKVEFRNVSFQYPGKDTAVLKNMSFTLNPGQLMVIVGENGCGKSSTVKLLNRLFDMSEGTILIDDLPFESYVAADIRRAQAVMSQEFVKYPLTIRENIGLGSVNHVDNIDRIHRATKLGGAFDFINDLPLGFETDIQPRSDAWSSMLKAKEGGPLKTKLKELEGEFDISGGQWQRLAISRTLMRAMDNDDIRLLCFDEPSSALDPKAEFELFERLRDFRGQKTLIFITHRFGHLTKFADLILYMKNGEITEQGTHAELLAKGEEYAHLYNIQAQAFSA